MNKIFYKECIKDEVYDNQKLSLVKRISKKFFMPSTNSVYMIRKMQYLHSKGGIIRKLRAQYIRHKLIFKYGIHIHPELEIGKGLRIIHPCSIIINSYCKIGENFSIWQNCTLGIRGIECDYEDAPEIGNDVKIYCNSVVLGKIKIADNVTIGANSLLIKDADVENGVYAGSPAKLLKINKKIEG